MTTFRSDSPAVVGAMVSCENCVQLVGMSWSWCTRFAKQHAIPVWRVGTQKRVIPLALLLQAMQAVDERYRAEQPESLSEAVQRLEEAAAARLLQRRAR